MGWMMYKEAGRSLGFTPERIDLIVSAADKCYTHIPSLEDVARAKELRAKMLTAFGLTEGEGT